MASSDKILREALASRFEKKGDRKQMPPPERCPSTIIDDDGCIIQRGFLIPSRTSSSHPRTSRPSTPSYKPIPAFERPTGSLFEAPEMRPLVRRFPDSLHRSTKSAGDLENMAGRHGKPPPPERRQTWQSGAMSSVWTTDELSQPIPKPTASPLPRHDYRPARSVGLPPNAAHMHRSNGVKQDLHALGGQPSTTRDSMQHLKSNCQQSSKKSPAEDIKHVTQAEAEDAIASDSEDEDDDDFVDMSSAMAAQRDRISYAERRMRQDERAAEEYERRMAEPDPQPEPQVPRRIRLVPTEQHESAIESDDEDEDGEVTEALIMATLHSDRNLIATSQGVLEPQTGEEQKRKSSKDDGRRASLSVKITPDPTVNLGVPIASEKDGVTPREIKSFETDAPVVACRKLRPSKSRPRPAKGVLKSTASPSFSSSSSDSSSKHVRTTKRPRASFAGMYKDAVAVMPSVSAFTQIATSWQKPRS